MGGKFFFNQVFGQVEQRYKILFTGGEPKTAKAAKESGLKQFGWNGAVLEQAGTVDRLGKVKQSNMWDFLEIQSYKKAQSEFVKHLNE